MSWKVILVPGTALVWPSHGLSAAESLVRVLGAPLTEELQASTGSNAEVTPQADQGPE